MPHITIFECKKVKMPEILFPQLYVQLRPQKWKAFNFNFVNVVFSGHRIITVPVVLKLKLTINVTIKFQRCENIVLSLQLYFIFNSHKRMSISITFLFD
jgi:hypothetical protein